MPACDTCLQGNCCQPYNACLDNADCVSLLDCLASCDANDAGSKDGGISPCESACVQAHVSGTTVLNEFEQCAGAYCVSPCSN